MRKSLTVEQQVWVENTLGHMALEECVGHLLLPDARGGAVAVWQALQRDVPLGGIFVDDRDQGRLAALLDALQSQARIPLVVAAAPEPGPGGGAAYPWAMALGAVGDTALAQASGRALAREARALGIHWIFHPSADLLSDLHNPETGLRAFGDKPARVRALAAAQTRGLQEDGRTAATAGRFPGAGADDRDSRLCTALNPLPVGKWRRTFGSVWRGAIDAGVMAVMTGHIAFPDYEGLADRPSEALPATLSRRLQVDLLRRELGFEGVIVSDAATSAGLTSRVAAGEMALQFILAGGDVLLAAEPRLDFERLRRAVRDGHLSEARVRESARRVLELKARVGLFRGVRGAPPAASEQAEQEAVARAVAERSVTVWRNDGTLPVRLTAGARILTVTLADGTADPFVWPELVTVGAELTRRGFEVDHRVNPAGHDWLEATEAYELVCVNVLGATRPPGFRIGRRNVVFTLFGSPFVIHGAPHWPNAVFAYGCSGATQRAAVSVWLGEIEPRGALPARLPWV